MCYHEHQLLIMTVDCVGLSENKAAIVKNTNKMQTSSFSLQKRLHLSPTLLLKDVSVGGSHWWSQKYGTVGIMVIASWRGFVR